MHSLLFRDKDLTLLCKNGMGSPLAQTGIYEQSMEGFDAASNAALRQANTDLKEKIQNLENEANVASRMDTYFFEDQALVLYINKMLIFVYVVISILFIF